MKSSWLPSNDTKGVGIDRYIHKCLDMLQQEKMKSPSPSSVQLEKRNPSIANVPPGESKWKREQRLRLEAEEKNNLLEQHNQQLKSKLADANLRMQQMVEYHSPESNEPCRNLTIEKAAQFVPMNDTSKLPPQKKSLVINESEG